ncbi:MgtC/SapB family protein [Tabrizicola sp. J26]|uniref:MgtC/SapB family protein n=1 Tax=Alitabrizicola rongguiensis TaxID=2909234 RepID=UPI001F1D664D|nr:MgtC/SapB family protein [Tabrizicola rongguiensis]MCF1710034.1 MgtC/SapB family protein [Tabrizicola rongguiensis]
MFERLDDQLATLLVAMLFGAIIGMERQARGRMAGVRTNALVAIGAASFVLFSTMVQGDSSPTRVAAQIVSGVGFLGAGLIFRDGFSVHGLNTAATLWCSAAVGMLCGIEAYPIAVMLTGVVMFVNMGLRPVMYWLDRRLLARDAAQQPVSLRLLCDEESEADLRAALVREARDQQLSLASISSTRGKDGITEIKAGLSVSATDTSATERVLLALAAAPGLHKAEWSTENAD